MSTKKNSPKKEDNPLTWGVLHNQLGKIDGLTPAERESLTKNLEKFIQENPDSEYIDSARAGFAKLQSQDPSEQIRWTIEKINEVISAPSNERSYEFDLGVRRLLYIPASKEKMEEAFMVLAGQVYSNQHSLETVIRALNDKKPISEQLRFKTLLKEKLYIIGGDKYYAGDFALAIKAYNAILQIDPDESLADERVRNSEDNRILQERLEKIIPKDALQFFYRYRSALAADDMQSAKLFLQTAIEMASERGVNFIEARQFLDELVDEIKRNTIDTSRIPADIQGLIQQLKVLIENEDTDVEEAFEDLKSKLTAQKLEISGLVEIADKVTRVSLKSKWRDSWLIALKEKDWGKAEITLKKALYLGMGEATDIINGLTKLLEARELISKIRRGEGYSKTSKKRINQILNETGSITQLAEIWKEIDNLYSELLEKERSKNHFYTGFFSALFVAFGLFALIIGSVFLFPAQTRQLKCPSPYDTMSMSISYPYYLSHGNTQKIFLTIANQGLQKIPGFVQVVFNKPTKIRLPKNNLNRMEVDDLAPDDLKTDEMEFGFHEQTALLSPPESVEFKVMASDGTKNVLCKLDTGYEFQGYIYSAPISFLQEIFSSLIGLMGASGVLGVVVSGLAKNVFNNISSLFTRSDNDKKSPDKPT